MLDAACSQMAVHAKVAIDQDRYGHALGSGTFRRGKRVSSKSLRWFQFVPIGGQSNEPRDPCVIGDRRQGGVDWLSASEPVP